MLSQDSSGLLSFTDEIQRVFMESARQLMGVALTRRLVEEQVIEPVFARLQHLKQQGRIERFDLSWEPETFAQGEVSVSIALRVPDYEETVHLSLRDGPARMSPSNASIAKT